MSSLQLVSAYPYGEKWDPVLLNGLLSTIVLSNITGTEILASTITSTNLATDSVTADKIIANAVTTLKIAANTITADQIQTDAITTTKLKAGSITADKIEAGAITGALIAADAIDASKIATHAIETDAIQAGAITADTIASEAITSDKIYAGAVTSQKISVTELSAISANLGTVTAGTVTAATVQTSANPLVNRVKMDIEGLTGYSSIYGQVFKLPTDGSAPIFANGNILSGTIIDTTIISNDFRTSNSLPWVELTAAGLGFRVTGTGGLYDTGVYDTATYGAGVTAYFGNASYPILAVLIESTLADIRFYNRSGTPSGACEVGDLCCVSGKLKICTTAGTGAGATWTVVGAQTT